MTGYNPNRNPAGSPDGGKFASGDSKRDDPGQVVSQPDWGHADTSDCPWGPVSAVVDLDHGVTLVSTPTHGGVKLSPERNAGIPDGLRRRDGWYEEDSDMAIPMAAYPESFSNEDRSTEEVLEDAKNSLRHWHPDEYEQWTGETIQPGQSRIRDRAAFDVANAENYVTTSAVSSNLHEGLVEVTATVGGDHSAEGRVFLVPRDEYRARGNQRFVVDPKRHREWGHYEDGSPINATEFEYGSIPWANREDYAKFTETVVDDDFLEVTTADGDTFRAQAYHATMDTALYAIDRQGTYHQLDTNGEPDEQFTAVRRLDEEEGRW